MNIFALHEPGGEQLIRDAGRSGWIVFTEAIGANRNDPTGKDFRPWAEGGIVPLIRLNNGYFPGGTIPPSGEYAAFAQRCANYVAASRGANHWIIGNEMNHLIERPHGEVITPQKYADCFTRCYQAIKAVAPLAQVLVGAVAPWNNQTVYAGNEAGDWVVYLADILKLIGKGCDGITLHTYTHQADPAQITDEVMMGEPFGHRHYNFRAYQDFMWAIQLPLRTLPVFITETDQDVPWLDQNIGWVQAAYKEINDWNQQPGNQQIHCLALYRWPRIDQWYIDGKNGVIADFRAALQHDYTISIAPNLATVLTGTNFRRTPGYQNKPPGDVIRVLAPGEKLATISGPISQDGLAWYEVKVKRTVGFVAKEDPAGVQLIAFVPRLRRPVSAPITQAFGEHPAFYSRIPGYTPHLKGHNGVDYGCPVGTPITAVDNGIVERAEMDHLGFGLMVMLRHSWGWSLYAHLHEIRAKVGAAVTHGERIGQSGNTGTSTGPHLHLGIKVNGFDPADGWGGYSDPLLFLRSQP